MHSDGETVCRRIFLILLAQLIFLVLWSLIAQSGPVFVQHWLPGFDFRDFYTGAGSWLHGANPYLNPRFDKPPLVLLVGAAFLWMPFGIAVVVVFVLNLGAVLWSVRTCATRLELSQSCRNYLTAITLLFYPTYFLIERGNLEGLILVCFTLAICTSNRILRATLVAFAAGLKLYPLLLLAPAIRNRKWRFALAIVAVFLLLLLPFHSLFVPFLHSTTSYGAHFFRQTENISPAGVIVAVAGMRLGRWIFFVYWAATLAVVLYRQRNFSTGSLILPFLPWMIAFPLHVFPYGGVLLLPVLTWKLHEMSGRKPDLSDSLFVNGFLLVGVQACAFTIYFQHGLPAVTSSIEQQASDPVHPIFHWMNSLGMCLILAAVALSPPRRKSIPRFEKKIETAPKIESVVN